MVISVSPRASRPRSRHKRSLAFRLGRASADGLRRWQWPEGINRITIFADAGEAGMQAAAALADRLNIAGITNAIVSPLHGDDFNDDLRHGATAAATNGRAGANQRARRPKHRVQSSRQPPEL